MRRGDQLAAGVAARRLCRGGVSRRHAFLHTNQLVWRQLAWISGRKHRGRCRVDAEKTRPCGGLAYNGMGTKRARCRPARGEEAMVAIVSTTAYLGLEARAPEIGRAAGRERVCQHV